jgi:hypothetical protein
MKFIRINIDGTMDECDGNINLKNIKKIFELNSLNKGYKRIKKLYSWDYLKDIIECYSWDIGKAGKENKHELPPSGNSELISLDSSDNQLLFGDIFLIKKNSKYLDLDISDYGLFYSTIFEGFDTCDDSDDDEGIDGEGIDDEEETNSLDNFIVDDNDNYSSDGDYELDEDNTEY